jgi:hypothetical protein
LHASTVHVAVVRHAFTGAGIHAAASAATHQPEIRADDVERFFQLYDRTHGKPTAAQLQSDYLDRGTPGLQQFIASRIHDADQLAAAIARAPAVCHRITRTYYAQARDKRQAIADILAIDNRGADAFLKRSGWTPAGDCRPRIEQRQRRLSVRPAYH